MKRLFFLMICLLSIPALLGAAPAGVGVVEPWVLDGQGPLYTMHRGEQGLMDGSVTDILVIGTCPGTNLINGLATYFSTVDYYDATSSTPSLATLEQYDAIITYSGWGWYQDFVALGNVVADYVDAGGGVVLTGLNHYVGDTYYLAGRMLEDPYMTINRGYANQTVALGNYDPNSPIMDGVSTVTGTWDIAYTSPYASATWVATWTCGDPGVYVSANGKVVGINMYVNDYASNGGDWILLCANALAYAAGGATGDVSLTLDPINPPIVIPPQGGQFKCTATITNNTAQTQAVQAWIDVILPNGSTYGPVLGPVNLNLGPNKVFTKTITQKVPGAAPAGVYQYCGHIVFTTGTDDACFEVTKTALSE